MKLYVHLMYYDARIAPDEFSVIRTGLSGEIIEVDIGELFDRRLEAALKRAAEERSDPRDLDAKHEGTIEPCK